MSERSTSRVAVIGAGIIGTMTAWQLAARGHQVTVYDQWNVPNDRGASAGESRIFRTAYKEGGDYIPLLRASLEKWDELEQSSGRKVLDMCGGLTLGRPDHPDVETVIGTAVDHDLEHRILDATEMAREYPQFALDPDEIGVFDPASGIFRPELAVIAARDESVRHGAEYRPYTPVLNIRPLAERIMVDTADDAVAYDKVVVATGPWAHRLAGVTRQQVHPARLVAGWFAAEDVPLHSPDRMPISIRRHDEAGFSCFPAVDGVAVKILPHHLPWLPLDEPEDLPRLIEPEFVRAIERAVERLLPGLDPSALRVSSWIEGVSPDGAPLMGPSSLDPRITLAVGMSGQGFKLAPMLGSIAADYVTDGASADTIDLFDVARLQGGAA
ncbi:N-methyl-L-tryptophan oxidase [Brachybacterium aquaticum]|uniref:Sarcosine oxidase n=1 Tax=Brachybacterium aquaticum TaxID=1432564 RepID=A0A841AAT2_9MICO|nr:N-methyl-L-tryptophan oxidase [Brachybacterium aquaticum]MBB5831956.1 sarcosine oxidase [Brachybacterium aquaticum]